jgi:hypothetical protein
MKKTLLLTVLVFAGLSAHSAALLAETPAAEPAPAKVEAGAAPESATAPSPSACAGEQASLPWLLPTPTPAQGCYAEYNCVHGTTVSCSSPMVGTCTSSGQGCGVVVCNGQTNWCPGRCIGDHHCATYCDFSPNASCDDYGCCVC